MAMGRCSILSIAVVFDIIAFILAVAAERSRSQGKETVDPTGSMTRCVYASDNATGFAVGAFLFLLASQALVAFVTRCLCCGRSLKPGAARAYTFIFFLLSWVCFLIAEICLIAGAVRNAKHYNISGYFGGSELNCEGLRKGTFAAGAAFALITMLANLPYYMFYIKATETSLRPSGMEKGVGMASYT